MHVLSSPAIAGHGGMRLLFEGATQNKPTYNTADTRPAI
jgi:hypothetical protein